MTASRRKPSTVRIPKTLGACADRLYVIRGERSLVQRQLDALEEERKAIEAHVIEVLPASDAEGIIGKVARATIEKKRVPSVYDWKRLYAHILKTRSFDLLQRRVSTEAVRERWNAKSEVPGVEGFTSKAVSVVKR